MKTKIYLCALATLFMIPQAMTAQTKKKAKKEVAIQLYSVRDILNLSLIHIFFHLPQ